MHDRLPPKGMCSGHVTCLNFGKLNRYDWGKIHKTGHVTLTTPILGVVCHPKARN